jgi:hypothetical protein
VSDRHHHRVGRRTGDAEAALAEAAQANRLGQRQRMAGAGLLLGRGDDPDIVEIAAAIRSRTFSPAAFTPSSLVRGCASMVPLCCRRGCKGKRGSETIHPVTGSMDQSYKENEMQVPMAAA